MATIRISLHISADQYLAYYQGQVKSVVARSTDGRNIQFPPNILQPFVTHDGIHGEFELEFDERNKFKSLRKVG